MSRKRFDNQPVQSEVAKTVAQNEIGACVAGATAGNRELSH
jgi:hypothetical protein